MEFNDSRIRESLWLLAEESGANIDYAKGSLVGMMSTLVAAGMDIKNAWAEIIIPNMPDSLRVKGIPPAWLNLDGVVDWDITFKNVVKFSELTEVIPQEMREQRIEDQWNGPGTTDWSCRDMMLDRYLYVCSIFQREHDREWASWREKQEEVNGVHKTMKGGSVVIEITPPKLLYAFNPFRKAGSQYIAEWAVSDMRKPQENSYNWHGQNTSRWLYAGCLLVQDGRVSIHT